MPLNLSEQIGYYEKKISETPFFWNNALQESNLRLAAFNLSICFHSHFMIGLMHWRDGNNPTPYFRRGLDALADGWAQLQQLRPEWTGPCPIDAHFSVYMAYLIGAPHPPVKVETLSFPLVAEAFFGNVLIGEADIKDWPKYADALPKGRRYRLGRQTRDVYASLLAGQIDPEEGVRRAEKLYLQREEDDFYEGCNLEGGGGSNPFVVDFRLGAILKKLGSSVPTIHAWKW